MQLLETEREDRGEYAGFPRQHSNSGVFFLSDGIQVSCRKRLAILHSS
jgi:hypothetical protein